MPVPSAPPSGGQLVPQRSYSLHRARRCAQIFVFFAEDGKVGVGHVKNIAERMRDASVNRAILVSQTTLTPFARQCIAELASKYLIESVRAQLQAGP